MTAENLYGTSTYALCELCRTSRPKSQLITDDSGEVGLKVLRCQDAVWCRARVSAQADKPSEISPASEAAISAVE